MRNLTNVVKEYQNLWFILVYPGAWPRIQRHILDFHADAGSKF